jgi:hypothetical protein
LLGKWWRGLGGRSPAERTRASATASPAVWRGCRLGLWGDQVGEWQCRQECGHNDSADQNRRDTGQNRQAFPMSRPSTCRARVQGDCSTEHGFLAIFRRHDDRRRWNSQVDFSCVRVAVSKCSFAATVTGARFIAAARVPNRHGRSRYARPARAIRPAARTASITPNASAGIGRGNGT